MAMASPDKVALGSLAFLIFWILAVFPAVPILPVGRTAGSLLGGILMVLFRVISPEEAYAAIDLPILGLLFGTMVVSIFLEKADMFMYLGKLLSWKSRGGKDLLLRVCLVSAISSALFTNDTSCVVLTEFVLKIARQNNLPPQPFLLALASSSNIGSAATPIGNPQNLVIAVQSGLSFGKFLSGIALSMFVGMLVNAAILLCYFWRLLSVSKDEEVASNGGEVVTADDDVSMHRFSPATMSHVSPSGSRRDDSKINTFPPNSPFNVSLGHSDVLRNRTSSIDTDIQKASTAGIESPRASDVLADGSEVSQGREEIVSSRTISRSMSNVTHVSRGEESYQASDEKESSTKRWKRQLQKTCVYVVTIGMLIALLMGLNMSWTAITAALALVVLDFKDARPCLEKVSYSLLIFFCGMFITVEGFNRTGIPSALWELVEPYSAVNHVSGVALLSIVIIILSNVASNVPTVLLLGGRIAASAAQISPSEEKRAWLILAWVSTVAGNLSLLGSAANLIVCEQAQKAQFFGYNLTFFSHLRFGVPSTLLVTAVGLILILSQ